MFHVKLFNRVFHVKHYFLVLNAVITATDRAIIKTIEANAFPCKATVTRQNV